IASPNPSAPTLIQSGPSCDRPEITVTADTYRINPTPAVAIAFQFRHSSDKPDKTPEAIARPDNSQP
ncbi:MAG: hypothetical protein ACRCU2_23535, partial [Planktothrix sp.]